MIGQTPELDSPSTGQPSLRTHPLLLLTLIVAAIGASVYFDLGNQLAKAQDWISGLGAWGPAVFILIYSLLTMLAVPGSVLTLAAGALFGLFWGVVCTFSAAMIGSCGAFLIARYLARDWIKHRIESNPRFVHIDAAMGREGLKIMALLRLSPVFPFNFLNFALGLTGVRFRDYFLAGFAMLPGTLLYVYYGFAAGSVAKIADEPPSERGIGYYLFMGVGLIATIAVTAVITRIARKSLQKSANVPLNDTQPGDLDDPTDGGDRS